MSRSKYGRIIWNQKLSAEDKKKMLKEITKWKKDPSYIPIFPMGVRLAVVPQSTKT